MHGCHKRQTHPDNESATAIQRETETNVAFCFSTFEQCRRFEVHRTIIYFIHDELFVHSKQKQMCCSLKYSFSQLSFFESNKRSKTGICPKDQKQEILCSDGERRNEKERCS